MDSFHHPAYGLSSQFTVKATAKKMAKSIVGKSIGSDQLIAPNVLPVARPSVHAPHAGAMRARHRRPSCRPSSASAARLRPGGDRGQRLGRLFSPWP